MDPVIAFILIGILGIALGTALNLQSAERKRRIEAVHRTRLLEARNLRFVRRIDETTLVHIFSIDNGINWYTAEPSILGFKPIGPASEELLLKFPGVIGIQVIAKRFGYLKDGDILPESLAAAIAKAGVSLTPLP